MPGATSLERPLLSEPQVRADAAQVKVASRLEHAVAARSRTKDLRERAADRTFERQNCGVIARFQFRGIKCFEVANYGLEATDISLDFRGRGARGDPPTGSRWSSPALGYGYDRPTLLIGHLLDTNSRRQANLLESLARPRGIEPRFPP